MAGLLLILVVVNAGVTGWLFATVRRITRRPKRPPRPARVLVDDYACSDEDDEGDC